MYDLDSTKLIVLRQPCPAIFFADFQGWLQDTAGNYFTINPEIKGRSIQDALNLRLLPQADEGGLFRNYCG
jgi:hypothetical protein